MISYNWVLKPVRVRRTSGVIESDWFVVDAKEKGRIRVMNSQTQVKHIRREEFFAFNPQLVAA